MTIDDVADLAMALPGVRESAAAGRRRWQLHGRLIARVVDDHTVVVRTGFGEREDLLAAHPTTFSVSPKYERHMMVLADLVRGDPDAVASALRAAHRLQQEA